MNSHGACAPGSGDKSLNILQVSTSDWGGGAERVAWNLFKGYRSKGHVSHLAVGHKHSNDPDVSLIPRLRNGTPWASSVHALANRVASWEQSVRGLWRLKYWLQVLAGGWPAAQRELGREDFHYPGTWKLLELVPDRADVLHLHNLHGDYFDLRALPLFGRQMPVIVTLHDAWLLSGHCAHSFDCERWLTGCGSCPDLTISPAVRRDATAFNWKRKRKIYAGGRFYVSTPSQWLMDKVKSSILEPSVIQSRVIPYGVDLSVFYPEDRLVIKKSLGLRPDHKVLLFVAQNARENLWKDYQTVQDAVRLVAKGMRHANIVLVVLGQEAPSEKFGNIEIRFVPFEADVERVASYYQASDLYLHAARADTFPNTVLEAQACGTPVVATAVGGIPEQIEEGVTGFLVPAADPVAMAARIEQVLNDDSLRAHLGNQAAARARRCFDSERQVNDYLDWYRTIITPRVQVQDQNAFSC
jgi:glycosyltransferase involved in cell wall biosynthesis